MPFEFPHIPFFNPDVTPRYDLTTGKGRLNYLADQMDAKKPVGFSMDDFSTCAIGEARKLRALMKQGLSDKGGSYYDFAAFFEITHDQSQKLFGSAQRTLAEEIALLRQTAEKL